MLLGVYFTPQMCTLRSSNFRKRGSNPLTTMSLAKCQTSLMKMNKWMILIKNKENNFRSKKCSAVDILPTNSAVKVIHLTSNKKAS